MSVSCARSRRQLSDVSALNVSRKKSGHGIYLSQTMQPLGLVLGLDKNSWFKLFSHEEA